MSELGLLRSVGAAGGPSDAELEEARSHARQRLRAAIAREQDRAAAPARPRRLLAVRPALLAGAATALVVVAGAAFALTALRPPAATARLDRLAVVAEGAQQPAATGARSVFTRSRVSLIVQQVAPGGEVITFVANQRVERWREASGRLRVRTVYDEPAFPTPEDQAAFEAAGLEAVYGAGVVEDGTFEPTQLPETARDWSADPDTLREQMLDELGPSDESRPAGLLELGAALLQSPGAQADLRAAVLRVLAAEDGIDSAAATTAAGAPAVSVTVQYETDGVSYERRVLFDATTAQLVEQELVALDELPGGLPAGTVLRSQVNEPSVPVPSLESPPATG